MNARETFFKYVGVVGIAAIVFTVGYVVAPFAGVTLPEGYTEGMFLCIGFFTAKNGPAYINKARGIG